MYLHTSTTSTIVMLIYRISTKPDQLSSRETIRILTLYYADCTTVQYRLRVYIIQFQLYKGQSSLAAQTRLDES